MTQKPSAVWPQSHLCSIFFPWRPATSARVSSLDIEGLSHPWKWSWLWGLQSHPFCTPIICTCWSNSRSFFQSRFKDEPFYEGIFDHFTELTFSSSCSSGLCINFHEHLWHFKTLIYKSLSLYRGVIFNKPLEILIFVSPLPIRAQGK